MRSKNNNIFLSLPCAPILQKYSPNTHSLLYVFPTVQNGFVITSATEYRLKLALSQLEMRKGFFFSFKPYIQKTQRHFYTMEACKDKYTYEVIYVPAILTEVLRWRFSLWEQLEVQSHRGCFSEHTTVDGLTTITAYLHNHIYTTIKLILPIQTKSCSK